MLFQLVLKEKVELLFLDLDLLLNQTDLQEKEEIHLQEKKLLSLLKMLLSLKLEKH